MKGITTDRSKRVLIYYPWIYLRAGGERVVLELASKSRHNIDVITHYYNPEKTFSGYKKINITSLSKDNKGLKRGLKFFLKYINTKLPLKGYDVLLVIGAGTTEFITFKNKSIPILYYCYTPLRIFHDLFDYFLQSKSLFKKIIFRIIRRLYLFFEKRAWKNFKAAACISQNVKNRIINYNLYDPNRIIVINPGLEIKNFKQKKTKKNYFLYVSRFKNYKRQDLAIRAFNNFCRHNPKTKFKLYLVGSVADKDYLDKLKSFTRTNKNIIYVIDPSDKELTKLYSEAYAFLFLAKDEDWGIAPLEAMASATPVISVNEGGPKEQIKNYVNGLLVNADVNKITKAMQTLVKNKKLYRKLRTNGLKTAKLYDWKIKIKQIDDFIDENC